MNLVKRAISSVSGKRVSGLISTADRARDRKDWETAASFYAQALELKAEMAPIWIQLGHALKEQGDMTGAFGAYANALKIQPDDYDAHLQMGHLLKISGRLPEAEEHYAKSLRLNPKSEAGRELRQLGYKPSSSASNAAQNQRLSITSAQVVFDVSDLISYFRHARVPTGIQRVQINVITSVIEDRKLEYDVRVVCFSSASDYWVEISMENFSNICALAKTSADIGDPEWRIAIKQIDSELDIGDDFIFDRNARLINIGTSWWLRNYFINVRYAKNKFGISYIPFVHDFIPIITPEHCVRNLTQDFIAWSLGVFYHADHFIANSESTARDLVKVASELGVKEPQYTVVRLDGEMSFPDYSVRDVSNNVSKIAKDDYVLFVSTIESRKNHLFAFDAWLRMLRDRGADAVPDLVCVGNKGWMVDAALARLSSNDLLSKKVRIISGVSDVDLSYLYANCLFTIYPSAYEGWGLPVTESLAYGKVPVVTRISSLPEAGGDLAEYFELGWEGDFIKKIVRLIDDVKYRNQKEADIRSKFKTRSWIEIARQIVSAGADLTKIKSQQSSVSKAHLKLCPSGTAGQLITFAKLDRVTIAKNLTDTESYRSGRGWNFPDDWGCWTKDNEAEITFSYEKKNSNKLIIYLKLSGLPVGDGNVNYNITIGGNKEPVVAGSLVDGSTKICKMTVPIIDGSQIITISIVSDRNISLERSSNGIDRRKVSIGLAWMYFCEEDDILSRQNIVEAMALNEFTSLYRR